MKYILIFSSFFSFTAVAEVSYKVPPSWLKSEDAYQILAQTKDIPDENFNQGTDKIFQTVLMPLRQSSPDKTWKLNGMMFDLTVSSQGTLGLLAMKGAPSATIAWVKKTQQKPTTEDEHHDPGYLVNINEHTDSHTNALVKTLVETGQVKNEANLRENLKRVTLSFKTLTHGIENTAHGSWTLSRLRLDLSVSASGELSPFTSFGSGLRVRLEWFPEKQEHSQPKSEVQKNMNSFFSAMLINLENWSGQSQLISQGLHLSTIRVGIGLTSKFNVGVVKSSVGSAFYAYFDKKKSGYRIFQQSPNQALYQFEEESLQTVNQNWNSVLQISARANPMAKINAKDKLYVIEPEKFHSGLTKAAKIGKYFAQRSKQALEKSEWTLRQVKIGAEISVTGGLALVTLSGATSCEMTFQPL